MECMGCGPGDGLKSFVCVCAMVHQLPALHALHHTQFTQQQHLGGVYAILRVRLQAAPGCNCYWAKCTHDVLAFLRHEPWGWCPYCCGVHVARLAAGPRSAVAGDTRQMWQVMHCQQRWLRIAGVASATSPVRQLTHYWRHTVGETGLCQGHAPAPATEHWTEQLLGGTQPAGHLAAGRGGGGASGGGVLVCCWSTSVCVEGGAGAHSCLHKQASAVYWQARF
jgi:hypothetical protein